MAVRNASWSSLLRAVMLLTRVVGRRALFGLGHRSFADCADYIQPYTCEQSGFIPGQQDIGRNLPMSDLHFISEDRRFEIQIGGEQVNEMVRFCVESGKK
jgi:hypothetical protein